ncbi:MAG TPA: hypothetical protein VND20_09025 [Candidatus Binataceae bacterium]|nr:hypothetical protein [Candidatus Binataceae bacterium]
MLKRLFLVIAVIALTFAAGGGLRPGSAWATAGKRVDCAKVMAEVQAGKKTKAIAADLSISTSSVYRCKKKAADTTGKGKAPSTMAAPAATASPTRK